MSCRPCGQCLPRCRQCQPRSLGGMADVPVIDLRDEDAASRIDRACRDHGFFSVTGHGVDAELLDRLLTASSAFFALPEEEKAEIAMARGGRAWRGWFPLGGELTCGVPDRKEGIYFGAEGPPDDPRRRCTGPTSSPPAGRAAARRCWPPSTRSRPLGHRLMGMLAVGLGLDEDWFARDLTADPTILFRIFHYPPRSGRRRRRLGGGRAHRLRPAHHPRPGRQRRPPGPHGRRVARRRHRCPGALVCNLGDMLERLTGGRYRSTPHRVRSPEAGTACRSRSSSTPAGTPRSTPAPAGSGAGRAGRALGRRRPPGLGGPLRRLPPQPRGQGLP